MPRKKRELQKLPTYQKRTDARIFILAYKPVPYKLPSNPLYNIIHVGAELHDYYFGTPDNLGEPNISKYNKVYCETTGTYWINNHHPENLKWIGQCQYSKLIRFHYNTDFETIFQDHDAIAVPLMSTIHGNPATVFDQFCVWHPREIIEMAEDIIKEKFPEYSEAWDKHVRHGYVIYYSGGYILRTEDYHEWCRFFFGVCDEIIKRYGATKDTILDVFDAKFKSGKWVNHFIGRTDGYEKLLFGFLAERLFTAFVRNLGNIMDIEYDFKAHV